MTDALERALVKARQGDYQERRLFRLDIVEREISQCCQRLETYLGFERIRKGAARAEAAKEYDDKFRQSVSSGKQCDVAIIRQLIQRHPEFPERL